MVLSPPFLETPVARAALLLVPLLGAASAAAQEPSAPRVDTLRPVVVTGSRTERPLAETPVSTQVIGAKEIEESGARNVAELLEEQPGLYLEPSFAGAGPQLQGLDPTYTLILIDGQRAIGRIGGVIDLERYPLEDVERVEIVRGASSALYGSDALAGVINIITKSTKKPFEVDALAGYGDRRALDLRARLGVSGSPGWASVSGGFHREDSYDLDASDIATSGSEREQSEGAVRGRYTLSRAFGVAASAEYRYRAQDGIDESGGGAVLDRRNRTEEAVFSLGPEWSPSAATRLTLRAAYSIFRDQFLLDQRAGTALDDYQDTREQMLQGGAQLDQWLHAHHLATVGAEGFYEKLRSDRLQTGQGDRTRGALYVQDEWTLLEQPLFVLLPGARLDVDSGFGTHATPRAALRVDPVSGVTLRASFGLGFRAPDFREQLLFFENPGAGYVVEGNPELDPERSRSWNVSAEVAPWQSVWASLALFRNDLADMISTNLVTAGGAGGPMRFVYQNIASAHTQGLDASVRLTPMPGLRLDFGYSYTETRDEVLDRPLPGRPTHRGTLSLTHREPSIGFETVWRAALVGKRTFYEDEDGDGTQERRIAESYASVDLRVAQYIAHGFSAFLLAENLLDAGDPEFLTLPPRSFSGGIRYVH
jgi:outer membrane receptor for ferrienterochelin and colicins